MPYGDPPDPVFAITKQKQKIAVWEQDYAAICKLAACLSIFAGKK